MNEQEKESREDWGARGKRRGVVRSVAGDKGWGGGKDRTERQRRGESVKKRGVV